jgi:hypothetical protein
VDLRLHLAVLWRFRFVVGFGLLAAILLAMMSYVRFDLEDGKVRLEYRQQESWASHAILFVTQQGFPWGRSIPEAETLPGLGTDGEAVPRFADPSRFATLAVLYARLAASDAVTDVVSRGGPIDGEIESTALTARDTGFVPLIDVAGVADTPSGARALAERATGGLVTYVREEQARNAIPLSERVIVTVVERPKEPELVEGRKLTRPIVLFLGVGMLTLALVYVLANLRPRERAMLRASRDGGIDARPA